MVPSAVGSAGASVLLCRGCTATRERGSLDYRCHICGGEFVVRIGEPRSGPAYSDVGMWRDSAWLPVDDRGAVVSLGEGDTPVVDLDAAAELHIGSVAMKCEHLNPTGSFKDRIASVAVSLAVERGVTGLVGTSSGNGGAAAAAYCARAGLALTLFALSDVVPQKLLQIRAFGARVFLVDGLGHDATATETAATTISQHAAAAGLFPFLTGGRYSPEAMEGAKTIAHELARQRPETTVVYAPVGGGGLLAGLGRGFAEVARSGQRVPRLVAVQPKGCATLAAALRGDMRGLSGDCDTTISGLQVAQLFDAFGAVDAIDAGNGHVIEVSDAQVHAAQAVLARSDGLLVEPAGATAYAGARADAERGALDPADRVIVIGTGAGYKDTGALQQLAGLEALPRVGPARIREVLDGHA
jgi:threonine synthase